MLVGACVLVNFLAKLGPFREKNLLILLGVFEGDTSWFRSSIKSLRKWSLRKWSWHRHRSYL